MDFVEDFPRLKFRKRLKNLKQINLYGKIVSVKPAFIFAERVENFMKVVFGFSIVVSAIIATVWGFTRLSEIVDLLINSTLGRIMLLIIGLSYFMVGLWKSVNLKL